MALTVGTAHILRQQGPEPSEQASTGGTGRPERSDDTFKVGIAGADDWGDSQVHVEILTGWIFSTFLSFSFSPRWHLQVRGRLLTAVYSRNFWGNSNLEG